MISLTDENFDEQVMRAERPVLVDFFAPWCGPCKMAEPIMKELAKEYQGKVKIGKVNVDEDQKYAQKYGVMSIPTLILFKNGKELERVVGFPGKSGLETLIKESL